MKYRASWINISELRPAEVTAGRDSVSLSIYAHFLRTRSNRIGEDSFLSEAGVFSQPATKPVFTLPFPRNSQREVHLGCHTTDMLHKWYV